jgi:hypothetical protein
MRYLVHTACTHLGVLPAAAAAVCLHCTMLHCHCFWCCHWRQGHAAALCEVDMHPLVNTRGQVCISLQDIKAQHSTAQHSNGCQAGLESSEAAHKTYARSCVWWLPVVSSSALPKHGWHSMMSCTDVKVLMDGTLTGVSLGDAKLTATTPWSFSWSSATAEISTSRCGSGSGREACHQQRHSSTRTVYTRCWQGMLKEPSTQDQHTRNAGKAYQAYQCVQRQPRSLMSVHANALKHDRRQPWSSTSRQPAGLSADCAGMIWPSPQQRARAATQRHTP